MNGKLYALLLEDVPKDADLLKEMLSDEGFDMQIDVVDTEPAYVSCLKSHNYDIIFADFTLPSFNGQEALELAKIICPYVPFICISGTIGEDRAVELLKQGATDYVLKDRMERLPFATKRALDAAVQLSKFRKTEIELQTNRRLLQTIINNATDVIYIKDLHGNYILINEAAEKAIGKTSQDVIGKDDTFFFSASEAQMIMDLDKKVLESGVSETFEEIVTLADGNIHIFSTIKSPMFDDFCKPTGLFGIARDVTEQKKAEEAIRQDRILLRTLIDNLPYAIYVKDDKGRKLVANSVDMQIMNCASEAEIIGKTDLEIFDTEVGNHGYAEDMSVLNTGQPLLNQEDCFIDTEGLKHWRLTSKIPLFNKQQQAIGLVGVGRDITEQRKAEEQLIIAKEKAEENNRLKTAFLNNMSHEIRTPMNGILGFAELLKTHNLSELKQLEFIKIIEQSGLRMLNIINDIVNISKIETGQIELDLQETNINQLIRHLHTFFKPEAEGKGLRLTYNTDFSDDSSVTVTDDTKLTQILSNLIKNALKFTKTGSINFGYCRKESMLEFYIKDTGIGIASEFHDVIFERFRQVEMSVTRNYEGSGLGLAISKSFVEKLGGKIWVESELGNGATFYFNIPYKSRNIDQPAPIIESESEGRLQEVNILIAEDDIICMKLLIEILENEKANLFFAYNGQEALEIVRTTPDIQIVLMDLKMPVMDGFEATKKIKRINQSLPIIAQSAYIFSNDHDKARIAGCNDFIGKPIKHELLVAKIKKQLNKE